MWQFSIFIGNRRKHKTTDIWRCANEDQCVPDKRGCSCQTITRSVRGLQGRVVDVAGGGGGGGGGGDFGASIRGGETWGLAFINLLSKQMDDPTLKDIHALNQGKCDKTNCIISISIQVRAIHAHSQSQGYISIIDSVVMNSESEGIL